MINLGQGYGVDMVPLFFVGHWVAGKWQCSFEGVFRSWHSREVQEEAKKEGGKIMKTTKVLSILSVLAIVVALATVVKAGPIPFDTEPTLEELVEWDVAYEEVRGNTPIYIQLVERDYKRAVIIRSVLDHDKPTSYLFLLKGELKVIEFSQGKWQDMTNNLKLGSPKGFERFRNLLLSDNPERYWRGLKKVEVKE